MEPTLRLSVLLALFALPASAQGDESSRRDVVRLVADLEEPRSFDRALAALVGLGQRGVPELVEVLNGDSSWEQIGNVA